MASGNRLEVYPSTTIATDTTTTGETILLNSLADKIIIVSTVSSRTDGTYTVTLEHSPDGENWFTYAATAAQSANSMVIANHSTLGTPIFHYVRASILSASTTTGADVEVEVYFEVKK